MIGTLSFFASRTQMDIESLGPKTVKVFYEAGLLRKVEDIYSADYSSLIGQKGIGVKTVEAIVDGVNESKKQPFKIVLSSLGIAELGKKSAEILENAGFDSFDKLKDATEEDLLKVDGIGSVMAKIIVDSFKEPRLLETIEKLKEAGLKMSRDEDEKESDLDQIFSGTTWCVTGSFKNFNPRDKALSEIEKRGGKTSGSISGKTTHLLKGEGGGSKTEKAEKLGIKIVSEDEFLSLIGWGEKKAVSPIQLELF